MRANFRWGLYPALVPRVRGRWVAPSWQNLGTTRDRAGFRPHQRYIGNRRTCLRSLQGFAKIEILDDISDRFESRPLRHFSSRYAARHTRVQGCVSQRARTPPSQTLPGWVRQRKVRWHSSRAWYGRVRASTRRYCSAPLKHRQCRSGTQKATATNRPRQETGDRRCTVLSLPGAGQTVYSLEARDLSRGGAEADRR